MINEENIEDKLKRQLTDDEKVLLDKLSDEGLLSPEAEKEPEIVIPDEEKALDEIRDESDYIETIVKPLTGNPYKNVAHIISKSKIQDKQVVRFFKYTEIKRDSKTVGHEGGIYKIEIQAYDAKVTTGIEKYTETGGL